MRLAKRYGVLLKKYSIGGSHRRFSGDQRMFNVLAFLTFAGGLSGMLHGYWIRLPFLVVGLNIFFIFFGGLFFYFSRVLKRNYENYLIYLLLIDSLVLGFMWFGNAGISGTIIYIYFGCMIVGLALTRRAILITSIILLVVLLVFMVEYYHPEWVTPYPNREAQFSDFIMAMVFTTLLIGFAVANLRKNYDFERHKVEEQNHELQLLNEEISQQNESIHSQNMELEKLNQLKNRLFSMVAHDFRNPLNSFRNVLEMIEDEDLEAEEKAMINRQLAKEIQYTANFIDNLLNWTKNQMQGIQLEAVALNLYQIAEENIGLLRSQIQQKKLIIENHISPHCLAKADNEMIKLVIRNLLSNAVKFSYEEGKIQLSSICEASEIVFKIEDLGKGISPEGQSRLFGKSFYFTPGTASEKGSGLGLMLCKDFVEQNGGKIWLESCENQGSIFYFSLPKFESSSSAFASNF
jgi:two-component system, sensor histidine kinase and response regulator